MPQSLQQHLGHMSNVAKLTLTQVLTAQVPEAPAVLLGTDGRRRKKITRRVGYARDADDDGLPGKQEMTLSAEGSAVGDLWPCQARLLILQGLSVTHNWCRIGGST